MEQAALYCVSPKTAFACPPSRYVAEGTGAHEWFSMQSYSHDVPYHGTYNNYFYKRINRRYYMAFFEICFVIQSSKYCDTFAVSKAHE